MAGITEEGRCPKTPEMPRTTVTDELDKTTTESNGEMTSAELHSIEGSLELDDQETCPNCVHDAAQYHQESVGETQHARQLMASPSGVNGEWFSMPYEGEIENVFTWELGDDSEGMPALESPESLILVDGEEPEGMLDDSPSRLEWLRQKRDEAEQNEHLDRVMAMIGHERVKEHFLAVKERVGIARKWNEDPRNLKLNLVIHGGQASVVKRIASLYSKFLFSVGAIPRIHFERAEGRTVPDSTEHGCPTVFHFSRTSKDQNSKSDTTSKTSTEDNTDQDQDIQDMIRMTQQSRHHVVLALSFDQLNKKYSRALRYNLEARREFPKLIRLPGYSEPEFLQLLVRMVKQRSLQVEGGFEDASLRVLVKRVLRRHESSSTTRKIRALRSELDQVCYRSEQRQELEYLDWARSHVPGGEASHNTDGMKNDFRTTWPKNEALIKREDIFGPEPEDARGNSEAWRKLQQLVGLESVKKHISQLFKRAKINHQREIRGLDPLPATMNHVFVGEPGVGKTTVARLYGQVLSDLNILSEGKVIETEPSSLIAINIGESELQTKEALHNAMGNVLIIDDADMLYNSSGHGTSDGDSARDGVIDTIVANVSGVPGEDRCVILIGSKDHLEEMFRNSNPGLRRRFPIEDAVHFESYDIDQLCQILDLKMAEDGNTKASAHAKRVARETLSRMSERPKFGNAGDVENLLVRARIRHSERLQAAGRNTDGCDENSYVVALKPEDFDPDYDRASRADQNREGLFSGFVGFEKIVNQFRQYQRMADGMRKHQIDPRPHIPCGFIFKGPPGTGKTTTARKVGKLFYDMGLLSSDEVVVCTATDLVGEYQGHTGPKVINLFESSLGKVLFIDEAYRLTGEHGSTNFTNQAVGELVDAMTKPRYAGKMVVVLAGYTADMEELLRSNAGLRSRFPTHVDFPCLEPQQCVKLLKQELGKLSIDIAGDHFDAKDNEKWDNIRRMFTNLSVTNGWANGRDIETLAKTLIAHVFVKAGATSQAGAKQGKAQLKISLEELTRSLQNLLRERKGLPNGTEH